MSADQTAARYFADLARRLAAVESVDDTMQIIVHAAVEVLPGCDHVSVSHLRGKELESRSSNDRVGPVLDALQTEAQEGPCLDSIRLGTSFASDDLADDPQWPVYGPRAVSATNVRSCLATALDTGGNIHGALNLFSDQAGTFGEAFEHHATVAILAAHASAGLYAAIHREQMDAALRNRDLIGQAKGILMARGRVDETRAFAQLAAASQRMNVKVTEIARRLIDGTLTDEPRA